MCVGFDIPEHAPAWLGCRSLLAGDSVHGPLAGAPYRLQAGSYKSEKQERTW
jgi:hypothetical protein